MARPKKELIPTLPYYIVTDTISATVNNREIHAVRGDRIRLTPTEYAVLCKYVIELKGVEQ